MPPFHLVIVTWGENHTGLFVDVALPTLLLPNNVPILADRPGTVFKIYAPAADAQRICATVSYQRLSAMVRTQVIEIEIDGAPAHEILTECHKQAIREAESVGAAIVFLGPDAVTADGVFSTLTRLADEGKKAVLVPGVRLAKETFVSAFVERFQRHGYGLTNVGPRDLVALALDHLHPTSRSLFWPSKVNWPSNLYWSVGREGFLCRCFHLHPIMVVTARRNVTFASTIDGDYVDQACTDREQIHIIEDSDDLAIFEISSVQHCVGVAVRKPLRARAIGRWGALYANSLHRHIVRYTTRIHSGVCTPLWETVQAQSDLDVDSALRWMRRYNTILRAVGPAGPVLRLVRRVAGRNTLTGRIVRSTHRFAIRLATRGPRKALRLTAQFFRSRFATLPDPALAEPAETHIATVATLGTIAADNQQDSPDRLPSGGAMPISNVVAIQPSFDPTVLPPPSYTRERAETVYGEAFRRCFEYLKGTGVSGDIAEFGTLHGYTGRLMATLLTEMDMPGSLWLYDSFTGLPADMSAVDLQSYEVKTNKAWTAGAMAVPQGTDVLIRRAIARILPWPRLNVVKGYFDQTLPAALPTQRLALVHVDCDLYTSAKYVLDQLLAAGLLQDGCVILCDDYNCNRANPRMGERRAMAEAFGSQHRFSYSPFFSYGWHGQAFLVHDQEALVSLHAEAA